MNIHGHVERAVQAAPTVGQFVDSTNDPSPYADRPDDYQIHFNRETLPDADNEVTFETAHERHLTLLLGAFSEVTGVALDRSYVDYAARHERQHFDAAKHLGATWAKVGIRIVNEQPVGQGSQLVVQPFIRIQDFKTSKLGHALVSAYPMPPSKGDRMDIADYGYSGIDELADLAMRRNSRRTSPQDRFYPVPLGSSGSTGKRRLQVYGDFELSPN